MVRKLQARNEPRKGRGFGFVTFKDEETQQKAIERFDGHTVSDRTIACKVAVDSPGKEDSEDTENTPVDPETASSAVPAEPAAATTTTTTE